LVAHYGNNSRRETDLKSKGRLITVLAVLLIFALSATLSSSFGSAGRLGVSIGDWVKYRAVREGTLGNLAWTGDWYEATFIRIEIVNVSGTVVNFVETWYYADGAHWSETGGYDTATSYGYGYHYFFVASNLSIGDTIPFPNDLTYVPNGSLRIDKTELRSYNGINRTVCVAGFSYSQEHFGEMANFYSGVYWDQASGFLLECTFLVAIPSYSDTSKSVGGLVVEETNLWQSSTPTIPVHLMAFGTILGIASVVTIGVMAIEKDKIRGKLARTGKSR